MMEEDYEDYSEKSVHQLFEAFHKDDTWKVNDFLETLFEVHYHQAIGEAIEWHDRLTDKDGWLTYTFKLSIGTWKNDPLVMGYIGESGFQRKFIKELVKYVERWGSVDHAEAALILPNYEVTIYIKKKESENE